MQNIPIVSGASLEGIKRSELALQANALAVTLQADAALETKKLRWNSVSTTSI